MAIFARCQIAAVVMAAAFWQVPAHATTTNEPSPEQKQRIICAVHEPQLVAALQSLPQFKGVTCGQTTADNTTAPAPRINKKAASKSAVADPIAKNNPKDPPPAGNANSNPTYLLRNDWADLGLLGAGCNGPFGAVSADKAKGAAVSFTRDYANSNKIWVAQGMGAAVFSDCTDLHPKPGGGDSGIFEKSFAIYAQINSDYNSNAQFAKKNNADTRTAGLSGELAYLSQGDIDVIRISPNVVFDNIKNTTAPAVMVQYVPMWISRDYIWHAEGVPGDLNWANFQFDPTLDIQYANAMGHSNSLQFSGKDQSLRIGPELTFIIKPLGDPGSFLSNIGITETFHPWYEAYTGRGSYWWSNAIFYNLTKDGNFAVSLSYNRGLDENSGNMTNEYIASLTGKY